jgi:hypothetical protein
VASKGQALALNDQELTGRARKSGLNSALGCLTLVAASVYGLFVEFIWLMQRNIEGWSSTTPVEYVWFGVVLFSIFLGPPAFLLGIWMNAHPWRVALALSWPLAVTSALTTLMGCPISSRCEGYAISPLVAGFLLPGVIVVGLAGAARLPAILARFFRQSAGELAAPDGAPTAVESEGASRRRDRPEWHLARDGIRRRARRQMWIGGTVAAAILILALISYALSINGPYGQMSFLFITAGFYAYRGKRTRDRADALADASTADTQTPPI